MPEASLVLSMECQRRKVGLVRDLADTVVFHQPLMPSRPCLVGASESQCNGVKRDSFFFF